MDLQFVKTVILLQRPLFLIFFVVFVTTISYICDLES